MQQEKEGEKTVTKNEDKKVSVRKWEYCTGMMICVKGTVVYRNEEKKSEKKLFLDK